MNSPSREMTFLEHLEVLRGVLLKILATFGVLFIPAWIASPYVIRFLLERTAPSGFALHYFTLLEPFFLQMKTALALDLTISFPVAVFFFWRFIRPGLTEREAGIMRLPALLSFFLALFGISFAILFIMPAVVSFSLSFAGPEMRPVIGIDSFVSMILTATLAAALLFQFPLVLLGLLVAGVVRVETLRKQRPAVVVILLVIAAILTPPDVVSQTLLFIPTYLLFEVTLFFYSFRKAVPAAPEGDSVGTDDDSMYREAEQDEKKDVEKEKP